MKTDHILYELIHAKLVTQIHRGRYKTGEFLPSFGKLCEEFGVSNITVRKAVHMLVEEGYVVPLKSKRFQVTFDIQDPSSAQEYLGQLIARKQAIMETFDTLAVLVPPLVMAGAQCCGEERLAALSRVTVSINPWVQSLSQIADELTEFHTILLKELQNQAVLEFYRQAVSFVTISYMPAFDLPHPLGAEFINSRVYFRRCEELIRAGRYTELKTRLRGSYRGGCDNMIRYIDAVTLNARTERPVPFHWLLTGNDPCPDMALVDELMHGIATGRLKPGQMLSPPPVLAERHGLSEFYVRRTLAFLGSVGITETINGRGTRVRNEKISVESCVENPVLSRVLLWMQQALQFAMLTCPDVIRESIRWEPEALPPDFQWDVPFSTRGMLKWITDQIGNDTLRGVYRQILQTLLFGYLVVNGHINSQAPRDAREECRAALEALRAGDREGFALRARDAFACAYRLAWEWMRRCGFPEESLTRLSLKK